MLLRLWRGDAATDAEADLMGACMVAAIDHGPLAPSALVARTIASTRAEPHERPRGRHPLVRGPARRRRHAGACRSCPPCPTRGASRSGPTGSSRPSARPGAACPASAIAGTSTTSARSGCCDLAAEHTDGRHAAAVRALAARVGPARRSARGREHRRGPGRGPDGPAARSRVRRLPVRHREELRARGPHRGGARAGAARCASSIPRPRSTTVLQFPACTPRRRSR